jgi:crotonobetainyl-CoA:carnitine CoA-transferase CaiB-like acyl-CoA transferase
VTESQGRRGPLTGIRIVECAAWHSGPGASVILGDLGAEVIKVEPLAGDPERCLRATAADGTDRAYLFELSNRGKRSISVDLSSSQGYAILGSLVSTADIFITNMLARTRRRLQIDYETLSATNSRLIQVSISGYGPVGDLADIGALDPLGQAISSMMYMASPNEPIPLDFIPLDQMTAITASHAALAALVARDRSGVGDEVQVSLYGSALWLQYGSLYAESILGRPHRPYGARSALKSKYQCRDGNWVQACLNPPDKYWRTLCGAIGRPALADDPRFSSTAARDTHNQELIDLLDSVFLQKSVAEWLPILHREGLLFSPIRTTTEVLHDRQAHDNEYIVPYVHPVFGQLDVPRYPVGFRKESSNAAAGFAPGLGSDTYDVLQSLGHSDADIARLQAEGVVNLGLGSTAAANSVAATGGETGRS